MSEALSFAVIGITFGAVYAITAMGLVVTYTTTGVFNFAHGAVAMVAAFSFYELWQVWNWNPVLAIAVIVFVEAPIMALVVERVLMRQMHGASVERSLMVSLGLLLILVGIATALWNPQVERIVPQFFIGHNVRIFGVNVSDQQLLTVGVTLVIALCLGAFLRFLRIGTAMRAVVDDPELVALTGARPVRVAQMGWILGFSFAALAGCLLASTVSTTGLDITTLTLLVVDGYAAAVIGRLRSLPWTLVGAMALGLAVEYAKGYLPNHIPAGLVPVIAEVLPVLFLFVALLIVPGARLSVAGAARVARTPRVASFRQTLLYGGALVVMAAIASTFLAGLWLSTINEGLTLGVVGLSLVLLTGYAGQVSLGQLVFLGVGAFTMGKIAGGGSWLGLLAGVGVSAGVGALLALPAIRLRGLYLALATLAVADGAYYAFFSNTSFFPEGGTVTVGRLGLPGVHPLGDQGELVFLAAAFSICAIGVVALRRCALGRRLVAMSDSPAAYATLGLNPIATKVFVFALASGLAGLGGCLYAGQQGGISATDVELFSNLILVLFVTIWGIRTPTGALLGGLSMAALPVAASHLPPAWSNLSGLVAGLGIILLGRSPNGVLGLIGDHLGTRPARPRTGFGTEPLVMGGASAR